MKPIVVLFDRDLRLRDNRALYFAAKRKQPLILLFVYDEPRRLGEAQAGWLEASLRLMQKRSGLVFKKGNLIKVVKSVIKASGAEAVFWNRTYDPPKAKKLKRLEKELKGQGIGVEVFQGNLLMEPWVVRPLQGDFFKVFAPFWRRCKQAIGKEKLLSVPKWIKGPALKSDPIALKGKLPERCLPGEEAALKVFKGFVGSKLKRYEKERDRLDLDVTSHLSAHIHFGEISVQEIWFALKGKKSAEKFLSEVGFREFSYHLLHHVPDLAKRSYNKTFDRWKWRADSKGLSLWKKGETGFGVVDAAMIQLVKTGWMPNRARMIVASFLTKDLLIDWRKGERWFWERLVDADPAINPFNWQWVAGSGPDASPWFRIFNPHTQEKEYDPLGTYVEMWVEKEVNPIVDHEEARKRALKQLPKKV